MSDGIAANTDTSANLPEVIYLQLVNGTRVLGIPLGYVNAQVKDSVRASGLLLQHPVEINVHPTDHTKVGLRPLNLFIEGQEILISDSHVLFEGIPRKVLIESYQKYVQTLTSNLIVPEHKQLIV